MPTTHTYHSSSSHTSDNKPVQHVRRGGVQGAIWKNTGKGGPFYTVTIERRYKDADGQWQTSYAFGRDQLLVLARVAEIAFHAIHELQQADRPRASGGRQEAKPDATANATANPSRGRAR